MIKNLTYIPIDYKHGISHYNCAELFFKVNEIINAVNKMSVDKNNPFPSLEEVQSKWSDAIVIKGCGTHPIEAIKFVYDYMKSKLECK